jgi:hypothetical protein
VAVAGVVLTGYLYDAFIDENRGASQIQTKRWRLEVALQNWRKNGELTIFAIFGSL